MKEPCPTAAIMLTFTRFYKIFHYLCKSIGSLGSLETLGPLSGPPTFSLKTLKTLKVTKVTKVLILKNQCHERAYSAAG